MVVEYDVLGGGLVQEDYSDLEKDAVEDDVDDNDGVAVQNDDYFADEAPGFPK